jgi:hypothetical protein
VDIFPSWKCRLHVRLEDYGKANITVPTKIPTVNALRGSKVQRSPLKVVEQIDPQSGNKQLVISSGTAPPNGPSSVQNSSSDGFTHPIDNIIPRTFDWKQNSVRAPDTLSVTLKWSDFPFDPRLIRAGAIEFYLGTLTADEFAAGVVGQARFAGPGSSGSTPLNLVPDTYLEGGIQRTNLRFTGWVDDMDMAISEGEPVVKLNCRDQTQLFLTQECIQGWHLDPKLPLDKSIAEYLKNYPVFEGMAIEFRPSGSEAPIISKVMSTSTFPPGGGPPVSKGGAGTEKLNVWDYLTDIVMSLGFIIRIDGQTIIIQPPRNLMNNKAQARVDDPYKTRTVGNKSFDVRTFVYGENLTELHMNRKFVRTSTNVEIRCYVPEQKRDIVARSPQDTKKFQITAKPGDGKSDQKWTVKAVQGVKDQKILQQIADSTYEMLNRAELSINVKTRDFASFGGAGTDPDILDMKPGDTFDVLVKRGTDSSTITEMESVLTVFGPSGESLKSLGYTEEFANAYQTALTQANFQTGFLTREVNVSGSVDQGVSIDVVGVNYVEARVDAPPPDPTYPQDAHK